MTAEQIAQAPVFFAGNRVWRCYLGGALLDEYLTGKRGKDGYFPEDWLASVTLALNGSNSQSPQEGLSRVLLPDGSVGPTLTSLLEEAPEAFLGKDHVARFGPRTAMLTKYLDSAIRLPVQCHPDRDFARRHYDSEFGKTESWLVLAGRQIDGEDPYLLMGFKPDVGPAAFKRAALSDDSAAMVAMMHRVPIAPGDVYIIPGRFPHAIGPGVLMIEVQEPTDWVVQPERWVGEVRLDDTMMWGPLEPELALTCFDYTGMPLNHVLNSVRCDPKVVGSDEGYVLEEVIGPDRTDCFGVQRLCVAGTCAFRATTPFWLGIVTQGLGVLEWEGGRKPVRRGAVFLVPAGVPTLNIRACEGEAMRVTVCLPPRAT